MQMQDDGLDYRRYSPAQYAEALRRESDRKHQERLEITAWVLKAGFNIFMAWLTVAAVLWILFLTNIAGRERCLEDGPLLCSYKAEYAHEHRNYLTFWRTQYPWDKPGFQVPANYVPKYAR